MKASDAVLLDALAVAAAHPATVTFKHPLALSQATRRRFNIGPFSPGGYAETVLSIASRSNVDIGPSFRQILDVGDWDRSVATSAPGQSEWSNSPHFADLAKLWGAGEYFPLVFSDSAIQNSAESTLTLRPR